MSDQIKHECGIGLIRLLKPLEYYEKKYGSALWGLYRMYILLEKQHNRGQDGAGLACIKLNAKEGEPYSARLRNNTATPLKGLYQQIEEKLLQAKQKGGVDKVDSAWLADNFGFAGQVLLGHLRYGTHGDHSIEACHPVVRSNNWKARSLMVAGNFNLTNVNELFQYLVDLGQHPRYISDTETVLERIGHFLDEENEELFRRFKYDGHNNFDISRKIAENLDIRRIIMRSAKRWDGGYAMGGIIGSGHAFVARDPSGIRPAYYWANDEVVVAASERPAIFTTFEAEVDSIKELKPGHVLVIDQNGKVEEKPFTEAKEKKSCSFERIYFSRGNDPEIYKERLRLGDLLVPSILKAVNYDLDHTVFSYIPNTAESAFWGMIKGVESYQIEDKIKRLRALNGKATDEQLVTILSERPRVEKAVWKDVKMRTFIADDKSRDDLVGHVYDVTLGSLTPGEDNLVVIDDSIVRGTTLKKSILRILSRLNPKKIVIVSSAPQIRYPDCYGIDMSQIGRFIAFQATIALLKERGMESVIQKTYKQCIALRDNGMLDSKNLVKAIYEPFTEEEISRKIADLLKSDYLKCKLEVVFQPLDNLAKAIPNHRGDWYFSGDYPTPGGTKVVNTAFINWYEGKDNQRAY